MVGKTSLTGPTSQLILSARSALRASRFVEGLWAKDYRLWKPDPAEISNRLGWLTVAGEMQGQISSLVTFSKSARTRGIRDVVLLGMGGSSLGPEVLRATFGSAPRYPKLWVLDSTVPGWVRQVTKAIHPDKTLFIVASKSGSTIEVTSLLEYFWNTTSRVCGNRTGEQFVAITDPSTSLEKLAAERQFWRIFTNPPDIGGRYSVLSYFGLVPAALLGIDLVRLLGRAEDMARRCRRQDPLEDNPGVELGATMSALAGAGRDKVTILSSPAVASFGLWAEQLLAESTGKEGTGLIPVAEEPIAPILAYSDDRQFVYLRLKIDHNQRLDRMAASLRRQGHPVMVLELRDRYDLGAEFFRWEWATAVAGHLLGIHPFDQPNVQESKDNTNRVLASIQKTGRLPKQALSTPAQAGKQLQRSCGTGTYVAILAYVTPSKKINRAIRALRSALITRHHVTTTTGYGPRYLHSTGQMHKGGPPSGLFVQLNERMDPDLEIPRKPFTFGTLAHAQAAGDIEALRAHHRVALSVPLGKDPVSTISLLVKHLSPSHATRSPSANRKSRRHPRKK